MYKEYLIWSKDYSAACDRNGGLLYRYIGNGTDNVQKGANKKYHISADRQVTSLAICGNLLIVGGAVVDKGEENGGFVSAYAIDPDEPVWDRRLMPSLHLTGWR